MERDWAESIKDKLPLTFPQIKTIRSLYLFPDVLKSVSKLFLSYPNRGGILELMSIDHSLNRVQVNKGITRLLEAYELNRIYHLGQKKLEI